MSHNDMPAEDKEMAARVGIIMRKCAEVLLTDLQLHDHVYELQGDLRINDQGVPVMAIRVDIARADGVAWVGCTELMGSGDGQKFHGGIAFERVEKDPQKTMQFEQLIAKVKGSQ